MKTTVVKVKIAKGRYVKVLRQTPAHFHDDILFEYGVVFVRWSKTEGRVVITKLGLSEEAINAMITGLNQLPPKG
ncbi:hypothetical protein KAR91_15030 [Candidatus Pacearchaeota archaeon]|nr:hypothetical protein [Candidatus Pacearchaeota archaeon]